MDDHRAELEDSMLLVAEDTDENTEIYVTLDDAYNFYPCISIEIGGEVDDETVYHSDDEAIKAYEEALEVYLNLDDYELTDAQAERIRVVDSKFNAYLTELLKNDPANEGLTNEDFDDLQDKIFRKLFEDYGIEVDYPTPMYASSGGIIVVQHPYCEDEE